VWKTKKTCPVYDQQLCHQVAVGLSISQLALTSSHASTSITFIAIERIRIQVPVRIIGGSWSWIQVCVRKVLIVLQHGLSGCGAERISVLVWAMASHEAHYYAVQGAIFTQPGRTFTLRDLPLSSHGAKVHSIRVWGLTSTARRWVGSVSSGGGRGM